jgi:hypothetical protein
MRAAKSPLRHRALAIALALVASAHILVAVSHSAMHGTFW